MNCTLMHRDIAVADIKMIASMRIIADISSVIRPEHIPVGVRLKNNAFDCESLDAWWRGRSIPASRDGIKDILSALGIADTTELSGKSFGLSLSDQYWIRPAGSDLSWGDINFFDNRFTEDLGELLLNRDVYFNGLDVKNINLMSPDNTSDGWLRKKWTVLNGVRCLVKGGSYPYHQEPYNEVLASLIAEKLDMRHTIYSLFKDSSYTYSICENFITSDTELVSAYNLMAAHDKTGTTSEYRHFLNCCEAEGLNDAEDFLNKMLTLDWLILNRDRHLGNYGLIRNAETLEYLGFAPIFDSGTSMMNHITTENIPLTLPPYPSKPFEESHDKQIELISSFDWLDISKLRGLEESYMDILRDSSTISAQRAEALSYLLKSRTEALETLLNERTD